MSFTIFSEIYDLQEIKLDTIITDPPYLKYLENKEVDSILSHLTIEEKIAQLMILAVYPNQGINSIKIINDTIKTYNIGGVIVFKGNPYEVVNSVNVLQKDKKLPLLVAMDAEWGVSMRVDSTVVFPKQIMLGAVRNDFLIYELGNEIARECKLLGVNINFSPVVDINVNPKNIIIGYRSFGEDKINVATKGFYYYRGMQDNKVLAVAKHFPGHGDTEKDSHKTLPIITHDYKTIFNTDLYPFRYLMNTGIGAVMIAHLHIPALDSTQNIASTLSPIVVNGLLFDTLNYKGLAITDALNMKGVSSYWNAVTVNVKAFMAGNTILLMPKNVGETIRILSDYVRKGKIDEMDLDFRVRKILALKKWLGLLDKKDFLLQTKNLHKRLVNDTVIALKKKLINDAITLVKNKEKLLPIRELAEKKVLILNIAKNKHIPSVYSKYMNKYKMSKVINIAYNTSLPKIDFNEYDYIFISLFASGSRPKGNYGIPLKTLQQLDKLPKLDNSTFVLFGSPYLLDKINTDKYNSVVVAYETDTLVQMVVPQKIYGAYGFKGLLPVSAGKFVSGTSITTKPLKRLKYGFPIEVGMNTNTLSQIDSVVNEGINTKAFPGAQVLVAKDGVVVFNKSYGYFTYDKNRKVSNENLYDLASLTKPLAVVLSMMKLYEQGKFDFNDKLSEYLTFLDTTDKKDIVFIDVLTHRAGFKPWIPFYLLVLKDKEKFDTVFSKIYSKRYSIKVCDSLYMDTSYVKEIYKEILLSPLNGNGVYKYSDLGFYLLKLFVEKETGQPLDVFTENYFYKQLGADRMLFNPLKKFSKHEIVPTEVDKYFRKTTVQGYVHDYGAAMLGGVGGHAGLFSNAEDLAKVLQMLLNGGEYGGKRFLQPNTITKFTSCPFCPENRRGIGFDKPEKRKDKIGPTCDEASVNSYGHTGFTGVIAWNDPDQNLIFIFLSNRIYPDINNKKLLKLNIRTKIQEIIYRSISKT